MEMPPRALVTSAVQKQQLCLQAAWCFHNLQHIPVPLGKVQASRGPSSSAWETACLHFPAVILYMSLAQVCLCSAALSMTQKAALRWSTALLQTCQTTDTFNGQLPRQTSASLALQTPIFQYEYCAHMYCIRYTICI